MYIACITVEDNDGNILPLVWGQDKSFQGSIDKAIEKLKYKHTGVKVTLIDENLYRVEFAFSDKYGYGVQDVYIYPYLVEGI